MLITYWCTIILLLPCYALRLGIRMPIITATENLIVSPDAALFYF